MDLKMVNQLLQEEIKEVNNLLSLTLESEVELLSEINSYLYEEKGKQLRPLLSLLAAKAIVASKEEGITQLTYKNYLCAAVVEMIHTATLLHDDVADNAPQRRGAESVQSKFSPAISVLTGDYWLAKALSLLVKENDSGLMAFYTKAVEELSEGELFQVQKSMNLDTTEEDYLKIIAGKTSSLFVAAIAGGSYCAGASKEIIEAMTQYGYYIGAAFQIRDDIFDYSPEIKTGKRAGADIKEKKMTLPLIAALKQADKKESDQMLTFIKESSYQEESLMDKSFTFVEKHGGLPYAEEVLEQYSKRATLSLKLLADSKYKRELQNIALYVGKRVI